MQIVISYIFSAIQAATIFGIVGSVLRSRFQKYLQVILFLFAVILGAVGINVIGDSYVQGVIWLILAGGVCHFLYEGPIEGKVFYLFFAQYICVVSEMILSTVMFLLPQKMIISITNSTLIMAGISVLIKVFVIIMGIIFVCYIYNINPELPRQYWIVLDAFLFIIIQGTQMLFNISMRVRKTEYFFYMQILLYILLILGIFVIFFLGKICWVYRKNAEYELGQLREQELRKIILYQKEVNEEMKKIRHDMKKHLSNIGYMFETNQKKEAKEYIANLTDVINETRQVRFCENYIIDAILNKHMAVCKNKNIIMDLSTDRIPELSINPVDISAILDNLLDNAVEAVEKVEQKNKYIKIKLFIYKENFTIVIKNPYIGKINVESKEFMTTKYEKRKHGYGIKSIKSAIEKNNGIFQYYIEPSEFTTVVMLPVN